MLWALVAPRLGVFVIVVEWTTFVCSHTAGSRWRGQFGAAPKWVQRVMANGKEKGLPSAREAVGGTGHATTLITEAP